MKCIECGKGRIVRKMARTSHEVRGVKFEVEGKLLVCPLCGFQAIPADLLSEHGRLVDEGYRKAAGLLSADEIHAARKRLGLNQLNFAKYLGVGEASVKRWELGALQDRSSDDHIRLKTDAEYAQKNLEEVCRRLGGKSPTEPQREVIFVTGCAGFSRSRFQWQTRGASIPGGAMPFVFVDAVAVN